MLMNHSINKAVNEKIFLECYKNPRQFKDTPLCSLIISFPHNPVPYNFWSSYKTSEFLYKEPMWNRSKSDVKLQRET